MKKTLIVLIAIGALWLPGLVRRGTAQDSIHYLVMIANQGAQISNQAQSLLRMDRHITQLTGQFEHLKESALGQIGAIADPIADLVAVPTDLLHTARDWHADFTGPVADMVTAVTALSGGTSFSESWRGMLQTVPTPSPKLTSGISTRAVPMPPMPRLPPSSGSATTRIAAWSCPMHGPMPPRLLPPRPPPSRTRSTP